MTSGTVTRHVGVDVVSADIEIPGFGTLAGGLGPLLFRRQLLALGPGSQLVGLGLLPLSFNLADSGLLTMSLRLAAPLFGLTLGPTSHQDDSGGHDSDDYDDDHDNDDSSHGLEPYTAPTATAEGRQRDPS